MSDLVGNTEDLFSDVGITTFTGVSGGLVVRASDSEVGGLILTRVAMNIVFLSKTYYSQKVLVILRKRLFRPDMTKNCLPGR